MKPRNLVVLSITILLGTLYAPAQTRDGSVTFTDDSNQSVTISRFGTVLSFKNSNGKETVPTNGYRVCLCGEKAPCVESATLLSKETISKLNVEFPKKGTTLKKGETLVVTATFRQAEFIVKRYLKWETGSSSVRIEEIISASKPLCLCTFEDPPVLRLEAKMCPAPPGAWWTCPPVAEINPEALKLMTVVALLDFSK